MHQPRMFRLLPLVSLALLGGVFGGRLSAQPVTPPRAQASVTVAVGGNVEYQMPTKKPIRVATNEKDVVAVITRVSNDDTRILIVGREPGTTRVVLVDVDGKEHAFEVTVLQDIDFLDRLIKQLFPTAQVQLVPAGGLVILKGTVQRIEDVNGILGLAVSTFGGIRGAQFQRGNLINQLVVGGVQQVQIDVVIAVVSRSEARRLGYNFLYGGGTVPFGTGIGSIADLTQLNVAGFAVTPVMGGGGVGGGGGGGGGSAANFIFGVVPSNFAAFIQALRTEGLAKLLAEPKLMTMSGRPATFLSGGRQAVPEVTGFSNAVGTRFEPFGTTLTFLPVVRGNGKIFLEVETGTSTLNAANGFTIGGFTVPGRDEQSVRTSVELEDGQTFAIGGLIQNQVGANTAKYPIFGDLPFIGQFFSNVVHSEDERELVILVTPHLVDPMDCNQVPKRVPGRETRSPDDFELFLEGILEAPRGQRCVFENRRYKPAYKNDATAGQFPCGPKDCCGRNQSGPFTVGNPCHNQNCGTGGCGTAGCVNGNCGPAPVPAAPAHGPAAAPAVPAAPVVPAGLDAGPKSAPLMPVGAGE